MMILPRGLDFSMSNVEYSIRLVLELSLQGGSERVLAWAQSDTSHELTLASDVWDSQLDGTTEGTSIRN